MPRQRVRPYGWQPTRLIPRAAQYLRMSTDEQAYSISIQTDAIAKYAAERGITIVRTYKDEGRSGLTIEDRSGLQSLISDVITGVADFTVLLVYDISRWGRFQDVDAGAYYEYLCRKAGIEIIYCVEPFDNDRTPFGAILKAMKRAMAAEYSRELSVKVFAAHCRASQLGFRQGGSPGLGLRRHRLKPGDGFGERYRRVVLVPGPSDEVGLVNRIFRLYVEENRSRLQIATILNREGRGNADGRPWRWQAIDDLLGAERYIGNNVYNRTSKKLMAKQQRNPASEWVRATGVFEAVVDPDLFARAQARTARRRFAHDDEVTLHQLRNLLERKGRLSGRLIDLEPEMPGAQFYADRFGGLRNAYALVGFRSTRDLRYAERVRERAAVRPAVRDEIVDGFRARGVVVALTKYGIIRVDNDAFRITVNATCCCFNNRGEAYWNTVTTTTSPQILVMIRLTPENTKKDFCFILGTRFRRTRRRLHEGFVSTPEVHRSDNLDPLFENAFDWARYGAEGASA